MLPNQDDRHELGPAFQRLPLPSSANTAEMRSRICEIGWRLNPLPGGAKAVRPRSGLWCRGRTHPGAPRHSSQQGDLLRTIAGVLILAGSLLGQNETTAVGQSE